MRVLDAVGVSLSVMAFLSLAWLLHDVFSRAWRALPRRRGVAWIWMIALVASFLAGLHGLQAPLGAGDDAVTSARPVDTRRTTLRLPFYVVTRTEEKTTSGAWRFADRRGELQLPWAYIGGALAYLVLGRRPNRPDRATPVRSQLSLR